MFFQIRDMRDDRYLIQLEDVHPVLIGRHAPVAVVISHVPVMPEPG